MRATAVGGSTLVRWRCCSDYTDDGAYYYVWGGGGKYPPHDPELSPWIPMRPWPAEVGLIKVKEALYTMGVPVAYMQVGPLAEWDVWREPLLCLQSLGFFV